MIQVSTVERRHNILIDEFGGSKGVRDRGALEAAVYRPYATFDQQYLYPSPLEKASAIFESLIINHPFIDGNKRIAYAMLRVTLLEGGLDIIATPDEKYEMVISASQGDLKYDGILQWLKDRITDI